MELIVKALAPALRIVTNDQSFLRNYQSKGDVVAIDIVGASKPRVNLVNQNETVVYSEECQCAFSDLLMHCTTISGLPIWTSSDEAYPHWKVEAVLSGDKIRLTIVPIKSNRSTLH